MSTSSHFNFIPLPKQTSFLSGLHGLEPPAYICGRLVLSYSSESPVHAKRILVSLTGKQSVSWHARPAQFTIPEPSSAVRKSSQRSKNEVHHRADHVFFSQTLEVWTSKSVEGYQDLTSLELPFSFCLPEDAPASIESSFGSIKYTLKASIYRKSTFLPGFIPAASKSITLDVPVVRYVLSALPEYNNPVYFESDPAWSQEKGLLYQVTFPKTCFGPGDPIEVYIKAKTDYSGAPSGSARLRLRYVEFGLKEYATYRTSYLERGETKSALMSRDGTVTGEEDEEEDGELDRMKVEKCYIARIRVKALMSTNRRSNGESIKTGEFWKSLSMKRPEKVRVTTQERLIRVEHRLKVKLLLWDELTGEKVRDVKLETDVVLTNVASGESYRIFEWMQKGVTDNVPPPTVMMSNMLWAQKRRPSSYSLSPPSPITANPPPPPQFPVPMQRSYSFDSLGRKTGMPPYPTRVNTAFVTTPSPPPPPPAPLPPSQVPDYWADMGEQVRRERTANRPVSMISSPLRSNDPVKESPRMAVRRFDVIPPSSAPGSPIPIDVPSSQTKEDDPPTKKVEVEEVKADSRRASKIMLGAAKLMTAEKVAIKSPLRENSRASNESSKEKRQSVVGMLLQKKHRKEPSKEETPPPTPSKDDSIETTSIINKDTANEEGKINKEIFTKALSKFNQQLTTPKEATPLAHPKESVE